MKKHNDSNIILLQKFFKLLTPVSLITLLSGCNVKPTDMVEGQDITYFELGNILIGIAWLVIAVVCILGVIIIMLKNKKKMSDYQLTPEETEEMLKKEIDEKTKK